MHKNTEQTVIENNFSASLRNLMQQKNITPKQLSIDLGVHISTVYYWINGRTLPTTGMIYRLALALQEKPMTLYGYVTEKDAFQHDRVANRGKQQKGNASC